MDGDRGNRESGKVRYRTRTLRVNGRLLVVVALCRRRAGGRGAAGSVGYVLAHVRNCGHLSRKREAEGNPGGRWREIVIRAVGAVRVARARGTERENFELRRGRFASQSRLSVQCITGLRRQRISPSDSKRRYRVTDRDSPRSYLNARRNPLPPFRSGSPIRPLLPFFPPSLFAALSFYLSLGGHQCLAVILITRGE